MPKQGMQGQKMPENTRWTHLANFRRSSTSTPHLKLTQPFFPTPTLKPQTITAQTPPLPHQNTPHRPISTSLHPQQKVIYIQQLLLMKRTVEGGQVKGSECTICMERTTNTSLNGCSHEFCIRCIKKWSKSKNTCPLCRERFHQINYRNKVIEVAAPPSATRPQRILMPNAPQQQRRIIYVPMLVYPQTNCFIYNPNQAYFITGPMPGDSGVSYSLAPTFFIPTL